MTARAPARLFFDGLATVYDLPMVQWLAYRPVHDALLAELRKRGVERVLDIGCGTGHLARRLRAALPRAEIVGCDFSREMLQKARRRRGPLHWVQGDAARLPFEDQSFDAVVSTEAFHWFPDREGALAECFRVTRGGGQLLVALVNTPLASIGEAAHAGSRLLGLPFYWPTVSEMRGLVERAGFRVERQRRIWRLNSLLLPPVLTCAVRPGL